MFLSMILYSLKVKEGKKKEAGLNLGCRFSASLDSPFHKVSAEVKDVVRQTGS